MTERLSDPPTAMRGGRVAPQDVPHDGMGKGPRLRELFAPLDRVRTEGLRYARQGELSRAARAAISPIRTP